LIDGQSFLSLLYGGSDFANRDLYWEFFQRKKSPAILRYAVRVDNWKLVSDKGSKYLFDIINDPGEKNDLKLANPSNVQALESKYKVWRWDTAAIKYQANVVAGDVTVNSNDFEFGPNPGYAAIDNSVEFNPDIYDLTIGFWINPDGKTGKVERIVSKGNVWRLVYKPNGRIRFVGTLRDDPQKEKVILSKTKVSPNEWTHVVLRMMNKGKMDIYINGVKDVTKNYEILLADDGEVAVGGNSDLTQHFVGKIHDLRFFNAYLTNKEVLDLYQQSPPSIN